jgi:hypothetical protein
VFKDGEATLLAGATSMHRRLAMLAIALLAFLAQSLIWETNSDTTWLITVIDRMHAGDRLYVDIIELNPPSSVWLYLAPVHLSYVTGFSAEAMVRAYSIVVCLLGVWLTAWMIQAGRLMPRRAILPVSVLLGLTATILIGNAFSERDHLGAVLVAPLLVLAAWRGRSDGQKPQARHWLVAGIAGGMIALVKPYYALIVVVGAACIAVRQRDWRAFFLPEYLVAASISVVYMAAFYLAYPAYFSELLPLLRETYMAFSWPLHRLAVLALPWLMLPLVYRMLSKRGARHDLAEVLLVAALAAWVPYFIQGKAWAYHTYPAVYLGSAALIVAVCAWVYGKNAMANPWKANAPILLLAVLAVLAAHVRFLPGGSPFNALATETRRTIDSPTVGILGGDIAAGHPLTRMIGGRWIEPYCSDWIGTFALRMISKARATGEAERSVYFHEMLETYLLGKRERLTAEPPQILIVDTGDGLVRRMLSNYGFADLLARYGKLGSAGEIAIYRLKDAPD